MPMTLIDLSVDYSPCSQTQFSVNLLKTPTDSHHPRPYETYQPQPIASATERNQRRVPTAIASDQLSGNRDPSETAKADHGIQRREPSSKDLGAAQLPHTNGREADVRTAGETEDEDEDDELCQTSWAVARRAG